MARYFLDTGVLVGLTFLHDLWKDDADRLFDTDNTLYTTRPVIFEYCNSSDSNSLETASVDWETEAGLFGDKISKVRVAQTNLDLKLRFAEEDELDLETLVDEFITETGLSDEIYPKSLLNERIRPNIREFLEEEIGERDITRKVARETTDALCDTLQTEAREARERIRDRVKQPPVDEHGREQFIPSLHFVDGRLDKLILSNAGCLHDRGVLDKLISTDKSHMYSNHERIKSILGIQVLLVKDEFADQSLHKEAET